MRCAQPLAVAMSSSHRLYEVRPRNDHRGVNQISDALPFSRLGCRSLRAVIRIYDEAGNVIETHEHKGDFKEW